MKRTIFAAAIAAVLAVSPLAEARAAQSVPTAQLSCADFLAVDDAYKPALVYWISGVDKLGVRETVTTVVDVATPVATVIGECELTPQAPLQSKVRDLYKSGRIALFDHH